MTSEALVTVTYETRFTTLTHKAIAYIDTYKRPDVVAEGFERTADSCIEYVSEMLEHKHGRAHPNEPPAHRRRISNRQKLQLVQEIIDGNISNKDAIDKIREALKR